MPLEISYGGSLVSNPNVTFSYRENPMLWAFKPLQSFVRCALHSRCLPPAGKRPRASRGG